MIDSVTGAYIFGIHLSRISMIQLPAVEHVGMKVIPCHPYQELSTETEARVFLSLAPGALGSSTWMHYPVLKYTLMI